MKKKVLALVLSGVLLASLGLSSCENSSPKSVIGAQLNDKGELVLTYSDNTTQNLGLVKGEDGKDGADGIDGKDGIDGIDGKDGKDLVACIHAYGDWQTQLSPTCTSIGYNLRTCSLCGDLDYQFVEAIGHTYNETAVDVVNNCKQHLISKTCSTCGDTALVEEPASKDHLYGDWETVEEYDCGAIKQEKSCIYCNEKQIQTLNFSAHTFDENTLCTTCGHQEFIQSEEYFEDIEVLVMLWGPDPVPRPGLLWWNKDRTFALKCAPGQGTFFIYGYMGNPVNIVLPIYDNLPQCYIVDNAFQNCTTLKSIYIPDTVTRIEDYAFDGCTNLEFVRFSENLTIINHAAFRNCISLKTLDFKNHKLKISIESSSFENCTSLQEVYFPANVICYANGNYSMKNCTSLQKIYIPEERRDYFTGKFIPYYPNLQIISYK